MHSATTATGRPIPSPRKTLTKNRPAPLSCRAAHQLAAPKPHVTSQLQCYIPAPPFTRHSPPATSHCQITAPGSQIAASLLDTNGHFRRNNNSRNSLKTNDRANSYSIQTATCLAGMRITIHYSATCLAGRRVTTHSLSNRQWQILEITVNLSKQTIAPRSNRHKNALLNCQKFHPTTACRESRLARRRTEAHQSLLTNHRSRLTRPSEFPRSPAESVVCLCCVCCSCNTFRFDEGAASSHLRPLLLYGWRRSRSKQIA